MTVTLPACVSVVDTNGMPQEGLPVYVFTHSGTGDGDT